jgi:D-sedoheptulose 7-phosphate isomerase
MDERAWLADYFERYHAILGRTDVFADLIRLKTLMTAAHVRGGKTIIAGNGGSAAMASHCAVDFTKNAGIRCVNFNEADLITCLANDYGYAWWLKKAIELYADMGDVVVLISSSGKSPNMLNAAEYAAAKGLTVVTFTGFAAGNPLRRLGQLNFWVDSQAYNIVETMHQLWLLSVCDLVIGRAEYPASDVVAAPTT